MIVDWFTPKVTQVDLSDPRSVSMVVGGSTHAGVQVTEDAAVGLAAVWRAVNLIAGTVASLPIHAYKSDGDERVRVQGGQSAALLANPHPDLTPFELWETVFAHMLLWGNAYLRLERDPAAPMQVRHLHPIHPSKVTPFRKKGKKFYRVGDATLTDEDILHLPAFGYDGVQGLSPIQLARQAVALGLAAEEFGARLFGSGSLATGILQTDQRLTPKQAEEIQARWAEKRAGLKGAHGTIVLDRGATFHQLSIPPEDAQFIETRRFQAVEIARIFGVPPHMLMETDRSTSWGTGIGQQTLGFVVYTLRPWLTRFEQRLTRALTPGGVYARFALEGLLRGDSGERAAFYKSMWELGALSTNEIRALEERPPVEGGDERFRPLNFGPLVPEERPR